MFFYIFYFIYIRLLFFPLSLIALIFVLTFFLSFFFSLSFSSLRLFIGKVLTLLFSYFFFLSFFLVLSITFSLVRISIILFFLQFPSSTILISLFFSHLSFFRVSSPVSFLIFSFLNQDNLVIISRPDWKNLFIFLYFLSTNTFYFVSLPSLSLSLSCFPSTSLLRPSPFCLSLFPFSSFPFLTRPHVG